MSNFEPVQLRSKKIPATRCVSTPNSNMENPLAPLIMMSGYMTKRTQGFTNKWKKRWWQLLGDGKLIYFQGEERLKLLGEIDIAHTCYDVRFIANQCEVKFPPVVSRSCCFSMSVLKRTYYLYTPTVEEAKKWVNSLSSTSYLLNRSRPRSLGYSPAVQVALEAIGNQQHSMPPLTQPPESHKLPSPTPPPPESSSIDGSNQDEELDEPSDLPVFRKLSHCNPNQHLSVPDLRFDMSPYSLNGSWIDGSPRIRSNSLIRRSAPPPPPPPPPPHRRASLRELTNTPDSSDSSFTNEKYKRSQRTKSETKSTAHTSKSYTRPRYRSHGDLHNWTPSTALPTAVQLMRIKQQWKNDYEPGFERLEKLQKREDAIKKRLEEMKKTEMLSFHGNRGAPVIPMPSPTEKARPNFHRPLSPDGTFSMYQSQPEYNRTPFFDEDHTKDRMYSSSISKRPRKPSRKAPKRRATPAYAYLTSSLMDLSIEKETEEQVKSLRILDTTESEDDNLTSKKGGVKSHEKSTSNKTNVWGQKELRKVCLCVCMCVCICVCMCVYVCMCVCVCMYVYMYVCMYVFMYVCMYVCMYICMYVCIRHGLILIIVLVIDSQVIVLVIVIYNLNVEVIVIDFK